MGSVASSSSSDGGLSARQNALGATAMQPGHQRPPVPNTCMLLRTQCTACCPPKTSSGGTQRAATICPCVPEGGTTCAASPTRNAGPAWKVSATRPAMVHARTVRTSRFRLARPAAWQKRHHGGGSRPVVGEQAGQAGKHCVLVISDWIRPPPSRQQHATLRPPPRAHQADQLCAALGRELLGRLEGRKVGHLRHKLPLLQVVSHHHLRAMCVRVWERCVCVGVSAQVRGRGGVVTLCRAPCTLTLEL